MGNIVPPNPGTEAYRQMLYRQLASIPGEVRSFITDQYANTQITVLPLPYWSTVRFEGVRSGAGPFVYTVDTSERKAFAYAQGQSRAIAGFSTGNATLADTNLLRASETRDNSDVWIWGIACAPTYEEGSEPALLGDIWRETSVQISLNGTMNIPLGTLEMFPGAGGLYGTGQSATRQPATNVAGLGDGGAGADVSYVSNGNPAAGNFFRLSQPFKWSAVGSAGADSSLIMSFTPSRAITLDAAADRAAVPVVAMVTPGTIEPSTAPEAIHQDVRVHLICVAVSKRSVNA